MNIVIRTEGGKEIGHGHLIRSMALARALRASIDIRSALERQMVKQAGLELGHEEDADVLVRDMWSHYPTAQGSLTVDIVDEVHERSREADLTFSIYGRPMEKVLCGLKYALIRPEFAKQPPVERDGLLVTLGGTDASNSTDFVCSMLESFKPRLADQSPMWEQLAGAEVVITSGGMTLLEAAVVGTPTLVMSHNLREHCRIMDIRPPWFGYLGPHQTLTGEAVRKAVEALLRDEMIKTLWPLPGRALVDGLGVERVSKIIRSAARETYLDRQKL